MTPTTDPSRELVFRRLADTFPDWVLLVPVGFALAVLMLVLFYRQDQPLSALLRRLLLPPPLLTALTYLWGLYVLAAAVTFVVLALNGVRYEPVTYMMYAVPAVAYPLLLGLLATLIICARRPVTLVVVVSVLLFCGIYLGLAVMFKPYFSWAVILVPVWAIALFYVGLMYVQDSKSVHPLWAAFLGLLRCSVYTVLAVVFLLPGCQTYDTKETYSKVLVLFDVSDSMLNEDFVAAEGEAPATRQDKVGEFLAGPPDGGGGPKPFLELVREKSPVTAYRFGSVIDDYKILQVLNSGDMPRPAEWAAWLRPNVEDVEVPAEVDGKPVPAEKRQELELKLTSLYQDLKGGTNVSGSALQAAIREAGHLIQAVIIFSDGQSNLGSNDSYRELLARAGNPRRPFHIITVGVGKFRQPVSIRVQGVQAPQQARPDDKFPVRVQVVGEGLADEEFDVELEVSQVRKEGTKWVPAGFKTTQKKKGKFKASGEQPYDDVEFEIDVAALAGVDRTDPEALDKLEGYWQFEARVPAHPSEKTTEKVHVSKRPAQVLVQKRKLRVLLFAGGPTREYQFVRTLFYREVLEKRMEMSVYLQTGVEDQVEQDVEKERLLTHFPDKTGPDDPGDRYSSLDMYDVVIAFDPDWLALTPNQLKLLNRWVDLKAGGLIFVAGPLYSYQVLRGKGRDMSDLSSLVPVNIKDNRLLKVGIGHDTTRPYVLRFPENAVQYDFLNISEDPDSPLQGWNEFFWDSATGPEAGKDAEPHRGVYTYYPVDVEPKAGGSVLARFAIPTSERVKQGGEPPFIATMQYGGGKAVYLGSGEFWRLRQYDDEFYQRFWVKLARYAGSGTLNKLSKYGMILAVQKAPVGPVNIEAQVFGSNLQPLPRDATPAVEVKRPADFDEKVDRITPETFSLAAKSSQGDWNGWFSGAFKVYTPGDYTLRIPVPGTSEYLEQDLTIYKPNPETENKRPNPGYLYQLATSAKPLLARLEAGKRKEIQDILQPPTLGEGEAVEDVDPEERTRLYFPLEYAQYIPELLVNVPPNVESTKGAFDDLWDNGWPNDRQGEVSTVSSFWVLLVGCAMFAFLAGIAMTTGLINRQAGQAVVAGVLFVGTLAGIAATAVANMYMTDWGLAWYQVPLAASGYHLMLFGPPLIGVVITAILLTIRQWVGALVLLAACGLWAGGVYLFDQYYQPSWETFPLGMSYVLGGVVGLLALEWLSRKLLRLA